MLLSQHAYRQDFAVLIPALVVLLRPANSALVRYGATALLLPLPYELSFFRRSGSELAVLLLLLLIGIAGDTRNHRAALLPPAQP